MTLKCKMRVEEIQQTKSPGGCQTDMQGNPVPGSSPNAPEGTVTQERVLLSVCQCPSHAGYMVIHLNNPDAFGTYEVGQEVIVTVESSGQPQKKAVAREPDKTPTPSKSASPKS